MDIHKTNMELEALHRLKVDTERIRMLPLDKEYLTLCISNYNQMERILGLKVTDKKLEDKDKNVFKIRLSNVQSNAAQYPWYTVWLIILKEENRAIGTLMVKNYPNENGEVIIGYVMDIQYRNKGYMTEAVKGIAGWIFQNPEVKCIVADTLKNNIRSHRVLQKVGMTKYKEDEECSWWKLEK